MLAKTPTGAGVALAMFALWSVATWLLEGRLHTFLRPEAVFDRLLYVVAANFLIGIVGAATAIRFAIQTGGMNKADAGFGPGVPSVLWIAIGAALGLALFFVQGAPSHNPTIILNAYAQVFAVSVAEVMVCWALVGGTVRNLFAGQRWLTALGAACAASVLFGIYHFGHSPPFNTIGMVAFLSFIGLWTSAFFFVSHDVYATIVFHNFLGAYGVVQALAGARQLDSFAKLQVPLLATALAAPLILVAVHFFLIRRR